MADHVETLARVALFSGLSDKELRALAGSLRERAVATGESVVSEGEGGIAFFVVAEGQVEVTVGERAVRTLGPGETFGEIALVDDEVQTRTAGVRALTPVRVLGLSAWAFRPFVREHPDVAWAIIQTLARRLREAGAGRAG